MEWCGGENNEDKKVDEEVCSERKPQLDPELENGSKNMNVWKTNSVLFWTG
jgi:hypothetical protein